MTTMNHSHQSELFDPARAQTVTVLGAGSVGSWAVYLLAKMGVTDIRVYDEDEVASHNCPMSLYGIQDVGRLKVEALYERIERDTGIRVSVFPRMYQGEPLRNTSVIAAVDTMAARSLIWKQVKNRATVDLFLDSRLNAAYIDVLAIDPSRRDDQSRYELLDFPDEEAQVQICGLHGIAYASSRAAGILAANLTQHWMGYAPQWRVQERCDTLIRVN